MCVIATVCVCSFSVFTIASHFVAIENHQHPLLLNHPVGAECLALDPSQEFHFVGFWCWFIICIRLANSFKEKSVPQPKQIAAHLVCNSPSDRTNSNCENYRFFVIFFVRFFADSTVIFLRP